MKAQLEIKPRLFVRKAADTSEVGEGKPVLQGALIKKKQTFMQKSVKLPYQTHSLRLIQSMRTKKSLHPTGSSKETEERPSSTPRQSMLLMQT
uniref:Uncharacterized protein n=1 Tax=Arion vulgaris TaxID=1028688 RepID=A0A0B7BIJ9_9EUPU